MFEQDALMVYVLYHVCEVWRVKNGPWNTLLTLQNTHFRKSRGFGLKLGKIIHSDIRPLISKNDVIWMLCKFFTNLNSLIFSFNTLWYIFGHELLAPFLITILKKVISGHILTFALKKRMKEKIHKKFSVLSLYFQIVK